MDNADILQVVNCIENDLRYLANITGENHISAYIVDGCFSLFSVRDKNGQQKLSFFRTEANND